ncbi:hypothetical protein D499_0I01350 [Hanseniaspora uvarum DSM 2768]|nr:hypothetical protein D499_0I01350 [Hanseniaspora uvarum DSM 2768]
MSFTLSPPLEGMTKLFILGMSMEAEEDLSCCIGVALSDIETSLSGGVLLTSLLDASLGVEGVFIFVLGPGFLISSFEVLGLVVVAVFFALSFAVAVCLYFLLLEDTLVESLLLLTVPEELPLDPLFELEDPVFFISFCLNPFIIFYAIKYTFVLLK